MTALTSANSLAAEALGLGDQKHIQCHRGTRT